MYILSERKRPKFSGKYLSAVFSSFALLVFCLLLPSSALAATLLIDPPNGSFGPGDAFVLTVRLDTAAEECINAAQIELHYPIDWMKVGVVSKGESFFSLWIQEPKVDHKLGIISLEGGIPAGYCGRIQGDPGKTNIVAKIVFSIPGNMIGGKVATGPEPLRVYFASSTLVLQNDGFGTPAPLSVNNGNFIRTMESQGMKNEWLEIVRGDTLPPEAFTATIERDMKVFQGKYFLVFSTVDKQSGVDHFEVREDDPRKFDFVRGKNERAQFLSVTSPYVLVDQTLGSRIIVRAIDHAGNIEEIIVPPKTGNTLPAKATTSLSLLWITIVIGLAVILLLVLGWWWRVRKSRRSHDVMD